MANNIKEVLEDTTWSGVAYGIDTHQIDEALAEIKRIIEEAKPPLIKDEVDYLGGDYAYDRAILEYHNNLLKALGE